jgi:transcriptional antiterminator RfaH
MYWAAAQLKPQADRLALHCLALAGFEVYQPRLREHRVRQGRRLEGAPPLFPGYTFVVIELQWVKAHYCPGVIRLVMDGMRPARVADHVIAAIRARERNGLVELAPRLKRGDRIRILRGPLREQLALYEGQAPHEWVAVLLQILGAQQRVTLPKLSRFDELVRNLVTPDRYPCNLRI